MSATLVKLKSLKKLFESGIEDVTVQMTIDKIIAQKIEEEQKSMRHLKRRFRRFERKYPMTSEEFYERFSKGELGDSADFVEWFAYCDMYRRSSDRIKLLKGIGE